MSFGAVREDSYRVADPFAADAARSERAAFIRKTYGHLLMAVLIFCGLEGVLLSIDPVREGLLGLLRINQWAPLIFLGGFMAVTWIAQKWAMSDSSSVGKQYVGLGLYTVAEAVFFVPVLAFASMQDANIVPMAGLITAVIFGGLTATVFVSGADFSFLRGALSIGMWAALGLIVASFFFPFTLGIWFAAGMIVLLSGFVLYETSNVLHHYRTHQHVAASLALFASVATLFFYVVRLLSLLSDD